MSEHSYSILGVVILSIPVDPGVPLLANPVDSANGLELLGSVRITWLDSTTEATKKISTNEFKPREFEKMMLGAGGQGRSLKYESIVNIPHTYQLHLPDKSAVTYSRLQSGPETRPSSLWVASFASMRTPVSLSAALSILSVSDKSPFPVQQQMTISTFHRSEQVTQGPASKTPQRLSILELHLQS